MAEPAAAWTRKPSCTGACPTTWCCEVRSAPPSADRRLTRPSAEIPLHSLRYVAATGAFKSLIIKGNPGLDPESAVTFNLGLLLDRDDLLADNDKLDVALDYWSYNFSDPLVVEPFPQVLELACPGGDCSAGDPAYLQRIRFGQATSLANLQAIEVNIVNGPDIKTGRYRFQRPLPFLCGSGRRGTQGFRYPHPVF